MTSDRGRVLSKQKAEELQAWSAEFSRRKARMRAQYHRAGEGPSRSPAEIEFLLAALERYKEAVTTGIQLELADASGHDEAAEIGLIVESVRLAAVRQFGDHLSTSSLRDWFVGLARAVTRRHLRRYENRGVPASPTSSGPVGATGDEVHGVAERMQSVRDALEPAEFGALQAEFVEDLPLAEISRWLGVPVDRLTASRASAVNLADAASSR